MYLNFYQQFVLGCVECSDSGNLMYFICVPQPWYYWDTPGPPWARQPPCSVGRLWWSLSWCFIKIQDLHTANCLPRPIWPSFVQIYLPLGGIYAPGWLLDWKSPHYCKIQFQYYFERKCLHFVFNLWWQEFLRLWTLNHHSNFALSNSL